MKVDKIRFNPGNPRTISEEKLEQLKESLTDFGKMMKYRGLIVDKDFVVLGGNQRLAAINQLGMKTIPDEWVTMADDLNEEEKKKFIILDNIPMGEWQYDILREDFDHEFLDRLDIAIPDREADFGDRNSEIDIDDLPDKIDMTFSFTIEEHSFVNKALRDINEDINQAVLKALGYE